MWDSKRDTDIKNRLLDSVGEGEDGMIWENSIETCILPYVTRWPVQVWCMKQGTHSWCTGTTQRDGMRWEGRREGDLGWGTHVHPWLIHVNIWQKPLAVVRGSTLIETAHPGLLPLSPKICSLHLCLFCCLASRVIVTIFLNFIYMH